MKHPNGFLRKRFVGPKILLAWIVLSIVFLDKKCIAFPFMMLTDGRPSCIKCTVPGHADVIIHYVAPDLKEHDPTWLTVTATARSHNHPDDSTAEEYKPPTPSIETNVLREKQHFVQISVVDPSEVTICLRAAPASKDYPMMFSIRPQIVPHNRKSVEEQRSFQSKLDRILKSKHGDETKDPDHNYKPHHHSVHSKMELEYVHMDLIATKMELDIQNIMDEFTSIKQQTTNLFSNRLQTYQAALWWPIFQLILLLLVALTQQIYMLYFFRKKDIPTT